MFPEEFQFIRPYWLYGFIPLILLVIYMFRHKLRNKKWESLCDKELLPYILIGDEPASKRLSAILTLLAGTLGTYLISRACLGETASAGI